MNNRIMGLIGLLVLLLVVAYAAGVFDSAPSTIDVPAIELEASSISAIDVSGAEQDLRVQLESGIWQMQKPVSWLADSISVNSFIKSLEDLKLESVVSTNPERYARYGVDSSGTEVRVTAAENTHTFWFAEDGPDFMTTYVRMDGDPRVFAGRPRVSVPTTPDRWRDKMIATIPAPILSAVNVRGPDSEYSLNKGEAGWTLNQDGTPTAADSSAVSRYLQVYSRLRADGFMAEQPADSVAKSIVELVLSTGELMSFTYSELENELALDYSGEPRAIYKLFSSRKNALIPDPETFIPK